MRNATQLPAFCKELNRKRCGCSLAAALLCAVPLVRAQSTPSSTEPAATVRTNADLVIVDVVVTDSKQNPVRNLTVSDFTLLEDGKPQSIKAFEEHSANGAVQFTPMPKLAPGMFTNYSPTPANGALNILLLDKLNTPMNAQTEVRDQVLKYLRQIPAGTRMAIFALTTQLRMLQGFTSNPEILRALVEGKKTLPGGSPLMDDAMTGDEPGADDPMMDIIADSEGSNPDAATMEANLQQFEAEQQAFQLQLRARYTLDAFNLLARYLNQLPGRKNLIWFSGSFPISILPDPDLQNPFVIVDSAEDEFRETTDLLARSQVAVYPIDARGLMPAPMLNASNSGRSYARAPENFAKDDAKFFQQTTNEHGTMMQMAEATGGQAFVNTNGLAEAVTRAIDDGSNYYTLAYTPADRNWNGRYRKIEVKLERTGLALSYRRGYYADDPNVPIKSTQASNQTQKPKNGLVPYSPLRAAMLHGGPDPTEILFVANVRPNSAENEASVAPGNQMSSKVKGPYRRYAVNFLVQPRSLNCPLADDGAYHCAVEFLTFVYDVDGVLVNLANNSLEIKLSTGQYAQALKSNFSYHQQISVPAKGEYYLRIGIHDVAADRMGALEVPVAAAAKLPPIAAPGPSPLAKPNP